MDDATLDSLLAAHRASPDNAHLLSVILGALHQKGRTEEALTILRSTTPRSFESTEDQLLAAEIYLTSGEPGHALELLTQDAPRCDLLRARAYLLLEQKEKAKAAYDRALTAEPALEDRALQSALSSRSRQLETTLGRLRVISNDDTNDTELSRLLMPEAEEVRFEDVGGLEDIKKQIFRKIILPFQKPSLFQRFKKRVGGGILLYGPPGCGKTLLARATAGECKATFFNVQISDVLDMYMGESEQKLHALFQKARSSAPAVLFFDEVEALGGKRQHTREATSSKLVSQFLSEMDGFSKNNHGVLILGATNVPWAVDPAFRRPGRFDRVLFVPPPDRAARESILKLLLQERPTRGALDIEGLARSTTGFSGADLANIVETAVDLAIEASIQSGEERPIDAEALQTARAEVKATTLEWLTTARNHARYANESGQYDEVLSFLKEHGRGI